MFCRSRITQPEVAWRRVQTSDRPGRQLGCTQSASAPSCSPTATCRTASRSCPTSPPGSFQYYTVQLKHLLTRYMYWLRGSVYRRKFLMQFSAWDGKLKWFQQGSSWTCSSRVLMRAGRRPWMPRVCLSSKVKAIPLNLFGSLIRFLAD